MSKILVPHGTTPTGFGVRLRSNGTQLRAISKCCGRSMRYGSDPVKECICKGCGTNYSDDEAVLHGALGNSIDVAGVGGSALGIVQRWVRNVTGCPDAKLEVKE